MINSHSYNTDKEGLVLQWTIEALQLSKKYQHLTKHTKSEIINLILNITQNQREITYRDNWKKITKDPATFRYSDYQKDGALYGLAKDSTIKYNHLTQLLTINTKHLFALLQQMDDAYDIRKSIQYIYLYNDVVDDQTKAKYIHNITTAMINTRAKVMMKDYEHKFLGQYSHLN